jgi:hypothetical protein
MIYVVLAGTSPTANVGDVSKVQRNSSISMERYRKAKNLVTHGELLAGVVVRNAGLCCNQSTSSQRMHRTRFQIEYTSISCVNFLVRKPTVCQQEPGEGF